MLPGLSHPTSDWQIIKQMKNNRFAFCASVFFILFADLAGQTIKVSGQGDGYAGEKIEIYLLSDPISEKLNPVAIVKCDSEGKFMFELPAVSEYSAICLKSGVYLFKLLVCPGKEYQISLPPYVPVSQGDAANPFFQPASLTPFVVNDTNDINNITGEFDKTFSDVITRITERVANKTRLDDLPGLTESVNRLTGLSENRFYRDYVTFRMIMLNAVAYGEYPGRKEDSVMINRRFSPENPAYTDLVNFLFRDYFRSLLSGPRAKQLSDAIKNGSLQACDDVILQDGRIENRELRHYVILLNMYYGFYNSLFDSGRLTGMLDAAVSEGATVYIRNLASVLKEYVFRMRKGSVPPQFSLPDTSGHIVSPSDLRGKYLLLVFAGDNGKETLSELSLLKSWYDKYREKLSVAVILTGGEFSKTVSFFTRRGYRWNFLDATGVPFLINQYEIRVLPGFILVDPEGRIAEDYCPLPSENLEGFIVSLAGFR